MEIEKMKATTPRVTVPVEPTVRMLNAGAAHMRDDALYTPNSVWSAMLSAAPAPEGGAVECERCNDTGVWPTADGVGHHCDCAAALAALAPYTEDLKGIKAAMLEEEAPAEAGEKPLYDRSGGYLSDPTPDALRVAVEAFGVITDLSVNLRQGGPDSSDLNDLSDALNTAVDVAHEALAALQAEQKGAAR